MGLISKAQKELNKNLNEVRAVISIRAKNDKLRIDCLTNELEKAQLTNGAITEENRILYELLIQRRLEIDRLTVDHELEVENTVNNAYAELYYQQEELTAGFEKSLKEQLKW